MKAQIVSFHCVLKDKMGKVLSSTFNHDVITQSDDPGTLLLGLAQGLENLSKGEKRSISLPANQAYGLYDPRLEIIRSRSELTHNGPLHIGLEIPIQSNEGRFRSFRVVGIEGVSVTLDANHPLAGQDLTFDIETTEARDATPEEIAESGSEHSLGPIIH